jgi:uncharacterized membrane protein YqjE
VLLLVTLLIAVFWDTHRVAVISALAGAFLAGAIGLAIGARKLTQGRSRLFSASLDELARDREHLRP